MMEKMEAAAAAASGFYQTQKLFELKVDTTNHKVLFQVSARLKWL